MFKVCYLTYKIIFKINLAIKTIVLIKSKMLVQHLAPNMHTELNLKESELRKKK
jgi:hypothetical protein